MKASRGLGAKEEEERERGKGKKQCLDSGVGGKVPHHKRGETSNSSSLLRRSEGGEEKSIRAPPSPHLGNSPTREIYSKNENTRGKTRKSAKGESRPSKKEEKKQEKPCSQSGIGEGNEKEGKIVVVVSSARPATVIKEVWEVNSRLRKKEERGRYVIGVCFS